MRKTDPLPPAANRLEWLCAVFGSVWLNELRAPSVQGQKFFGLRYSRNSDIP
jgi:hypothetical protein